MMIPPTSMIVIVCPSPQAAPIIAEPRTERWRLTIVAIATTWSGSVACRMPRKKPRTRREKTLVAESGISLSASPSTQIVIGWRRATAPRPFNFLFYVRSTACPQIATGTSFAGRPERTASAKMTCGASVSSALPDHQFEPQVEAIVRLPVPRVNAAAARPMAMPSMRMVLRAAASAVRSPDRRARSRPPRPASADRLRAAQPEGQSRASRSPRTPRRRQPAESSPRALRRSHCAPRLAGAVRQPRFERSGPGIPSQRRVARASSPPTKASRRRPAARSDARPRRPPHDCQSRPPRRSAAPGGPRSRPRECPRAASRSSLASVAGEPTMTSASGRRDSNAISIRASWPSS